MKHPDSLILYVETPKKSAEFFHKLFDAPIVEASDNFAMLALSNQTMLGLWARHDVSPRPVSGPGGFEIALTLESDAATDSAYEQAKAMGAKIVQSPVRLDFGYTFVFESPDGHFVRAFSPM